MHSDGRLERYKETERYCEEIRHELKDTQHRVHRLKSHLAETEAILERMLRGQFDDEETVPAPKKKENSVRFILDDE